VSVSTLETVGTRIRTPWVQRYEKKLVLARKKCEKYLVVSNILRTFATENRQADPKGTECHIPGEDLAQSSHVKLTTNLEGDFFIPFHGWPCLRVQ
jgi:hypothetical protein